MQNGLIAKANIDCFLKESIPEQEKEKTQE